MRGFCKTMLMVGGEGAYASCMGVLKGDVGFLAWVRVGSAVLTCSWLILSRRKKPELLGAILALISFEIETQRFGRGLVNDEICHFLLAILSTSLYLKGQIHCAITPSFS